MTTAETSPRGASTGVVLAALATSIGALPLLLGMSGPAVPTGALHGAGWPAFGVAAALVLDRGTEPRLGRVLAALALLPALMAAIALPMPGGSVWIRLEDLWRTADVVAVLLTSVLLGAAMGHAPGRLPRRRLFWLLLWCAVVVGAVLVTESQLDTRAQAVVVTLGMWSLAGLVTRLTIVRDLRPLTEPFLDVGAVALTLAIGAAVGVVVLAGGTRAGIPAPDLAAVFAAVTSSALAWPVTSWWRGSWLARRYGTGALTPADVVSITADLHHLRDPRELIAKAAEMVAASSGQRDVTLVLGADSPDVPPGWVARPLMVADDRVGTLLLDPDDPEGPEPRQARIVEQLLPTVALVCRAVGLAVEAEHTRQDVTRQRDAERARILSDLHDGLGPVLAGMSMRVQAELRRTPTALLESLAPALAEARGDLRRIVSGLAPSALDDSDLPRALDRLITTFEGDGRQVELEIAVEEPLPGEVTVAVYRFVAEGVTNAFRHGGASHVAVRVGSIAAGCVAVEVQDDGTGGPIAPGIGLMSLRQRAEQLGGSLAVGPHDGGGTLLRVELPREGAA
jgi:signal transduction histidine kinase